MLEALKRGPMTASEISKTTGIATGTASTLLTKLAKSGEVAKAERGYKLARLGTDGRGRSTSTHHAAPPSRRPNRKPELPSGAARPRSLLCQVVCVLMA